MTYTKLGQWLAGTMLIPTIIWVMAYYDFRLTPRNALIAAFSAAMIVGLTGALCRNLTVFMTGSIVMYSAGAILAIARRVPISITLIVLCITTVITAYALTEIAPCKRKECMIMVGSSAALMTEAFWYLSKGNVIMGLYVASFAILLALFLGWYNDREEKTNRRKI